MPLGAHTPQSHGKPVTSDPEGAGSRNLQSPRENQHGRVSKPPERRPWQACPGHSSMQLTQAGCVDAAISRVPPWSLVLAAHVCTAQLAGTLTLQPALAPQLQPLLLGQDGLDLGTCGQRALGEDRCRPCQQLRRLAHPTQASHILQCLHGHGLPTVHRKASRAAEEVVTTHPQTSQG